MTLKLYQPEIISFGVIILIIAIWKISEMIRNKQFASYKPKTTLSYSKVTEGMAAGENALSTKDIIGQTDKILAEANDLIQKKKTENGAATAQNPTRLGFSPLPNARPLPLSTEGYTPITTENEMTIHQRQHAKTFMDDIVDIILPNKVMMSDVSTTRTKEGLENNDKDPKKARKLMSTKLTSLNNEDSQSAFKLRDYYIKSAYNCFNPDNFKNSTVSMDACLYVIGRGCRVIDFEIFSVDNQPVIASSSVNSYNYKETYNHIPVSEAFEILGDTIFAGNKCPNPSDPFIIHMRIMSQNITMYDNLANIISRSKSMARNLLGTKYGYEYHSKDLGDEKLLDFKGKIILMIDATNDTYRNTKLFELMNMSSNSLFLSKKTYTEVKNIGDPQSFKEANKKNMCLVVPEKSGRPVNEGHNAPFTWGCQLVAMCFQEPARDEKLKAYEDKFDSVGYAFVLKPEDLRYVPITIAPPTPPNPAGSMKARPFKAPGFSGTI